MPWTEVILTLLVLDKFSVQFCLLLGTGVVHSSAVLHYNLDSFSVFRSVMWQASWDFLIYPSVINFLLILWVFMNVHHSQRLFLKKGVNWRRKFEPLMSSSLNPVLRLSFWYCFTDFERYIISVPPRWWWQ
jgi:hypothetical protein